MEREACDRCHGQKLRCTRDLNHNTCARCHRAGAICVTSSSGSSSTKKTKTVQGHNRGNRTRPRFERSWSGSGQTHTRAKDVAGSTPWLRSTLLQSYDDEMLSGQHVLDPFTPTLQHSSGKAQRQTSRNTEIQEQNVEADQMEHLFLATGDPVNFIPFSPEDQWTNNNSMQGTTGINDFAPLFPWCEEDNIKNNRCSDIPSLDTEAHREPQSRFSLAPGERKSRPATDEMEGCMQSLLGLHMSLFQSCNQSSNDKPIEIGIGRITETSRSLTVILDALCKCSLPPSPDLELPKDATPQSQRSSDSATSLLVLACYIQLLLLYIQFVDLLQNNLSQCSPQPECSLASSGIHGGGSLIPSQQELDVLQQAQLVVYLLKYVGKGLRTYLRLCIGFAGRSESAVVSRETSALSTRGRREDIIQIKRPIELILLELAEHEGSLKRALDGLRSKLSVGLEGNGDDDDGGIDVTMMER